MSGVDSTPIASNRFLMVPVDSSAARMPRPGATIAVATLFNSAKFIASSSNAAPAMRLPVLAVLFARHGATLRNDQHLDPRQRLAFQRFEERAASGRYMRQTM